MRRKSVLQLFENLTFTNTFTKEVIADTSTLNKPRQVPSAMFSYCNTSKLVKAKYLFNPSNGKLYPSNTIITEDNYEEEDDERGGGGGALDDHIVEGEEEFTQFELILASNSVAKECFGTDMFRSSNKPSSSSSSSSSSLSSSDLITPSSLRSSSDKSNEEELMYRHFVRVLSGYDHPIITNEQQEQEQLTKYYAHCYGGFQFGSYAGQLGDGRAISLGQVQISNNNGDDDINIDSSTVYNNNNNTSYNNNNNKQLWELQLKGAGHTPFSRHADGRAVLRSSIREFLCSEFMDRLGVPTTRAFSLVRSKERAVLRDEFYDNNPKYEYGAIVMRVAPSFVRFGSFDVFYYRYPASSVELQKKEHENIEVLMRYVIRNHFEHLLEKQNVENGVENVFDINVKELFAKEVVRRTAKLIADWMSIGFVHGVMNTDNMSVLGLTIDYGPFGFIDYFSENYSPNHSDSEGRYRYKNQPAIAFWNLQKFMRALAPVFLPEDYFTKVLSIYAPHFEHYYLLNFRKKLGLIPFKLDSVDTKVDVTDFNMFEGDSEEIRNQDWEIVEGLLSWMHKYRADFTNFFRFLSDVDKNNLSDEIVTKLMGTLESRTTDLAEEEAALRELLKTYVQRLQTSPYTNEERKKAMDAVNPRYILRNYITQQVIEAAEKFDYEPLYEYFNILRNPFEIHSAEIETKYGGNAPQSARCLKLSCSS